MRSFKHTLISLFLLTTVSLSAQDLLLGWAKGIGGNDFDIGNAITTDANGNVYTTGSFRGTVDFDPGSGTLNFTSVGGEDIFVQKLNAQGDLQWAKKFGNYGVDVGEAIAIDSLGNVYVTGYFYNNVDFGGTTLNASAFDAFVLKLNTSGDLVWVKKIGGNTQDSGLGIAVDGSGNVYSTGFFEGTLDLNPGSAILNFISNGDEDIYIQKLDANGQFVWARQIGGSNQDRPGALHLKPNGDILLGGYFADTVDFDPSLGIETIVSHGSNDIFILNLNDNGDFFWVKQIGGTTSDEAKDLDIDGYGNIYLTGYFTGTVDFDPGTQITNLISNKASDVFTLKLDANGNYVWAISIGGTEDDTGFGIAANSEGYVYTTGAFKETVDFDPGTDSLKYTAAGLDDIFIQKLDPQGNFIWAKRMGGTLVDEAMDVATGENNTIYFTGHFADTVHAAPGFGSSTLIANGGYGDIFILKWLDQSSTGIAEDRINAHIKIYPNPTNGTVFVETGDAHPNMTLAVFDLYGRKISTQTVQALDSIQIDLPEESGLYIIRVMVSGNTQTYKILKR